MTSKSKTKTKSEPFTIARRTRGEYQSDLYFSSWDLVRYDDRYRMENHSGAAIQSEPAHYLSRTEAIAWVATDARDPVTGYGYTREQAELMVDGVDAGKGYREPEATEDRLYRGAR